MKTINAVVDDERDDDVKEDLQVHDASVDYRGNIPIRSKTGVWRAALYIIGIEFSERLCYFGLATNLIIYLTKVLQQDVKTAAKNVNYWTGVTTVMPLLGGFLADSYLGRFSTVVISTIIYLLGLCLLIMSEFIPSFKPQGSREQHEVLFFVSIYLISVGSGGHKPSLESFGADQFDITDREERIKKLSYFNWWNAALCSGLVLGVTFVVYLQDNVGWGIADITLMMAMAISLVVFCFGHRFYRYRLPEGNPCTPLLKVIVAAIAKRKLSLPSDPAMLHEIPTCGRKRLLSHTNRLRCLDKAAIIENQKISSGWRLATVSQVEEMKRVLDTIPIWLTTQGFGLCVAQGATFFIKQSTFTDRHLGPRFEVPPATVYTVTAFGMIITIAVYDKYLVPFLRRVSSNERGFTIFQRIGIGMALSTFAIMVAALVEKKRLAMVRDATGRDDHMLMSVLWLAPQFLILGIGDGFALVGLQEYFYEQVSETMRSLRIALYLSVLGSSNFLSSLLITVVDKVSRSGGRNSWFGSDLDNSRLDCFYWFIFVVAGLNLGAYMLVTRMFASKINLHKKISNESMQETDEQEEQASRDLER